jgi:hypothetical protein
MAKMPIRGIAFECVQNPFVYECPDAEVEVEAD